MIHVTWRMQSLKLNKPHLPHVFGFTVLLISKYLLGHLSLPCLHIIMSSPLITSFGFSFNCLPFSFPLCQSSEPGKNHFILSRKRFNTANSGLKNYWEARVAFFRLTSGNDPPKQDHQSGSPGGFYLCHNQAGGLSLEVLSSKTPPVPAAIQMSGNQPAISPRHSKLVMLATGCLRINPDYARPCLSAVTTNTGKMAPISLPTPGKCI